MLFADNEGVINDVTIQIHLYREAIAVSLNLMLNVKPQK